MHFYVYLILLVCFSPFLKEYVVQCIVLKLHFFIRDFQRPGRPWINQNHSGAATFHVERLTNRIQSTPNNLFLLPLPGKLVKTGYSVNKLAYQ